MTPRRKSYFHRGDDLPLVGSTIPEHFAATAKQFPDHDAVVSLPQHRRLTYAQLAAAVDQLARGLVGLGFEPGDRIGIWSTNNLEWLLVQMATARVGIILVDINPANRARELAHALQCSEVQGVFLIPGFRSADYVGVVRELMPELESAEPDALGLQDFPHLRRVMLYDPAGPDQTRRPAPGFTLWSEVLAAGSDTLDLERITVTLDPDDTINIQYTSGTTGLPKPVALSHHNILNNAYQAARAMGFAAADRLCVPVPFYHCFGMVLANLMCLSVGACIVIPCEHFEALPVLEAVAAERCTGIHGVPTMFIAELEHPRFAEFDLSSLRTGIMAGAPCPPALMKRVMQDMGCREILIGYGQTEASPLTHLTAADDDMTRRVETVGRNLPHQEVKIVSPDTGHIVPLGEVGELCFRGYHVMKGYYRDAAATREAIDVGGWLHSGDLGTMDEAGYVRITGRLKDLIIRGGENIYPSEIEAVIFRHSKVAQVGVIGIPDEYYGEEVMAWVQLHEGETATAEEIQAFCGEELAHFKVPKTIRFVDEFPLTVTGKLQKFRMREIAVAEMSAAEG